MKPMYRINEASEASVKEEEDAKLGPNKIKVSNLNPRAIKRINQSFVPFVLMPTDSLMLRFGEIERVIKRERIRERR